MRCMLISTEVYLPCLSIPHDDVVIDVAYLHQASLLVLPFPRDLAYLHQASLLVLPFPRVPIVGSASTSRCLSTT